MNQLLEPPVQWEALGELIDQNQRNFLAKRGSHAEDFTAWFKTVDLFRAAEEEHLILRSPTTANLRQHRAWLTSLLAEGERLILSMQSDTLSNADFTLADAEATLEILYFSQREWHGPRLSEERRRDILRAVFNGEESAA